MPGGIEQGGRDVLGFKERVIREEFLTARSMGNEVENVAHPQAVAADARSTAAFARFDCDTFQERFIARV